MKIIVYDFWIVKSECPESWQSAIIHILAQRLRVVLKFVEFEKFGITETLDEDFYVSAGKKRGEFSRKNVRIASGHHDVDIVFVIVIPQPAFEASDFLNFVNQDIVVPAAVKMSVNILNKIVVCRDEVECSLFLVYVYDIVPIVSPLSLHQFFHHITFPDAPLSGKDNQHALAQNGLESCGVIRS